ncbi:uncharacterized protein LOC132750151 [Ruditapes philippinarum]|uniref:uncharacterized protein LOC132750151 n=1 Tax=Ruditapes philippinarum TaxID=129788 RepID=UPI00295A7B27|nr:uncharacterized protein LOC132750151 [Ruditapes philippinarum]
METLRSAINSSMSEKTVSQTIYKMTSLKPTRIEKKMSSEWSETSMCSCEERHVTLYCRGDDILLCKQCKHKNHVKCHVERIEHVAKGILESKELETTLKELNTLKSVFERLKENRRLKKLQHRQEKRSVLQLSKRWTMLQSTRLALSTEVGKGMDRYKNNLDQIEKIMTDQSSWVAEEIDHYLKDFSYHITNRNELGTFEVLHQVKKDLKSFYNVLSEISEDERSEDIYGELKTVISGIYFCENQGSVSLSRNLKHNRVSLPILTEKTQNIKTPEESHSPATQTPCRRSKLSSASRRFRPAFRPQAIRMATFVSSLQSGRSSRALTRTSTHFKKRLITDERPKRFDISMSENVNNKVEVSAMCPLPGGKLAVIDSESNKIKLFSKADVAITEVDAGCSIWDLTTISKSQILVTCPSKGKLQHVDIVDKTLGPELVKTGYILTQKDCRAICYVSSKIYVSYSGIRPCIKVMTKDGIMCRSIESFKGQITLFKNPLYMVVTKLGKLIYVSDFSLQRIVKIDQKGKLHGTVDMSPGWPLGLVMTRDDKLIIASSGSNDVKIIHRGSRKWDTLVISDWLKGAPCSVTVRETKRKKHLYVACAGSSVMNVFSMA